MQSKRHYSLSEWQQKCRKVEIGPGEINELILDYFNRKSMNDAARVFMREAGIEGAEVVDQQGEKQAEAVIKLL